ncbi:MAG: HdeD family acid-resistance protein [Oscillospiraceae bacterium]
MNVLKQNAGSIFLCIFEVVIGILLLLNPVAFTTGIIIAVGIVLFVLGLRDAIHYFRMEAAEAAGTQGLLKGLILSAAGLFCMFRSRWFIAVFPVLSVIYGLFILMTGFGKVQWTFDMLRMKKKKWFLAAISAVVTLLCAAVILKNPFTSSVVLWKFTGIFLIVEAVIDVVSVIVNTRKEKAEVTRTAGETGSAGTEETKTV